MMLTVFFVLLAVAFSAEAQSATYPPVTCAANRYAGCGVCWEYDSQASGCAGYFCSADAPYPGCSTCHVTVEEADACVCARSGIKACFQCWASNAEAMECSGPFAGVDPETVAPSSETAAPVVETFSPSTSAPVVESN